MNKNKAKNLFWSFVLTVLIAIIFFTLVTVSNIVGNAVWIVYTLTFLLIWNEIYDSMKGE